MESSLEADIHPTRVRVIPERLTEYRRLVMRETGTVIKPWQREVDAYLAEGKQPPDS